MFLFFNSLNYFNSAIIFHNSIVGVFLFPNLVKPFYTIIIPKILYYLINYNIYAIYIQPNKNDCETKKENNLMCQNPKFRIKKYFPKKLYIIYIH